MYISFVCVLIFATHDSHEIHRIITTIFQGLNDSIEFLIK